jgi:hypothetical protein
MERIKILKNIASFELSYKGLVKMDKVNGVDCLFSLTKQSYKERL